MDDITKAAANGVNSLWDIAPIVTILVLIILALLWFISALLKDAREERTLNRAALQGNTAILSELKELIRGAISK